ncbi:MAG: hypothetical protein JO268_18725 [Pseudonocardiales bacterium]|nr:hypothetical protein [Pseudonocardiales bacterium]
MSSLAESIDEIEGALDPQELVNAWRSAKAVVADSFVWRWNATTTWRMLLIDNVNEVADQEIGIWVAELLPRLEKTSVVLTRTPEGPSFSLSADAVHRFDIVNFDEDEVRAYLDAAARLAGHKPVSDFLVKKVHETSQGHPATLAAVYELLWGSDAPSDADPGEFLRELPDRPEERAAALVERLVWRPDDDALERALWAAAVPRRFNARLLKHLIGDPPLSRADQKRVFDALGRFTFTEQLKSDGSLLRLHSYVRTGLLQRMSRTEPERFDGLHASAAEYYGRELARADGTYGAAFVYEHANWQRNKREWLYHLGYATREEDRSKALLEFTRVFLDAFWWWGHYIQFDFCDQLVTDLAHLAARQVAHVDEPDQDAWPELIELHNALRRVIRGYPLRSVKSKNADWGDVRDALLTVQQLCGLQARDARRLNKDKRHVAALLCAFLARTWRHQACERPEADQYYSRAEALFAQDKDWSESWVAFERAELRCERGEMSAVPDLWHHAADLLKPYEGEAESIGVAREERAAAEEQGGEEPHDELDEEMMSNLHRLRADCCWASGEPMRSAMWYGRAVLHAYLFHLVGGPPDDYTLQFYVDIRARALSRLFYVWRQGDQDAAVALASEMSRAFPATYGRESGPTPAQLRQLLADEKPVPLAQALFPRGPEVSEIGSIGSPFTQEFNALVEALDLQQTSSDLHDPAWP